MQYLECFFRSTWRTWPIYHQRTLVYSSLPSSRTLNQSSFERLHQRCRSICDKWCFFSSSLTIMIWLYLEWASIIDRISFPKASSTNVSIEGRGDYLLNTYALMRSMESTHIRHFSFDFFNQHWIGQPLQVLHFLNVSCLEQILHLYVCNLSSICGENSLLFFFCLRGLKYRSIFNMFSASLLLTYGRGVN